jgi:glycine/D-amino acid oxidase-like deaminating enzyme
MELTRSQVAVRLRRSIATVRRLEGHVLHPRRDARGTYQFSSDEVDRLLASPAKAHRHARSAWLKRTIRARCDGGNRTCPARNARWSESAESTARLLEAAAMVLESAEPVRGRSADRALVPVAALQALAASLDAL